MSVEGGKKLNKTCGKTQEIIKEFLFILHFLAEKIVSISKCQVHFGVTVNDLIAKHYVMALLRGLIKQCRL